MKCKKFERLLSKSFDGILQPEEKEILEAHLESCLHCQAKREEYQIILEALREKAYPETKPYFWERLQPKLKEKKKYVPLTMWKRWSLRAIPVSLVIIMLLIAAIAFLIPDKREELSQTEVLLLRNLNPLQETRTLLEEESVENKNMMLIFSALEERNNIRRYLP